MFYPPELYKRKREFFYCFLLFWRVFRLLNQVLLAAAVLLALFAIKGACPLTCGGTAQVDSWGPLAWRSAAAPHWTQGVPAQVLGVCWAAGRGGWAPGTAAGPACGWSEPPPCTLLWFCRTHTAACHTGWRPDLRGQQSVMRPAALCCCCCVASDSQRGLCSSQETWTLRLLSTLQPIELICFRQQWWKKQHLQRSSTGLAPPMWEHGTCRNETQIT